MHRRRLTRAVRLTADEVGLSPRESDPQMGGQRRNRTAETHRSPFCGRLKCRQRQLASASVAARFVGPRVMAAGRPRFGVVGSLPRRVGVAWARAQHCFHLIAHGLRPVLWTPAAARSGVA